ncbi:hypothetical protein HPB48_001229 [Haemaphysalis longicornis]|uniref:Uncharacterized protein n=1 Tax=Haemaphysalis longicornis TaxID=44386 RepID=A0A9J6FHZ2_HAELO|nr:hypothetical protein HPB48_001229 [Haemaphysalis longicornis]
MRASPPRERRKAGFLLAFPRRRERRNERQGRSRPGERESAPKGQVARTAKQVPPRRQAPGASAAGPMGEPPLCNGNAPAAQGRRRCSAPIICSRNGHRIDDGRGQK